MAFRYPIVDPFHRQLYKLLIDDLEARRITISTGGAFASGNRTTEALYAQQVGYIECLETVLEKCRQIEVLMHGGEPNSD